jgi:hypothetical protein
MDKDQETAFTDWAYYLQFYRIRQAARMRMEERHINVYTLY